MHLKHSKEEIANYLTHGFGLWLSMVGFVVLLRLVLHEPDFWRQTSFIVYGISVMILFAASTLYHASLKPATKKVLRIMDHIAVYILIAGTYTPFLLLPLRGNWGWTLLIIVWGLAIAGACFKLWFTGKFRKLSTAVYLGMGWLIILAVKPMIEFVPNGSLGWLLAGGLFYSFGVIFYNWNKLRYNHALWHLFVLAGSCCHFLSITLYL